jgi:hypothetical protein
MGARPGCRALRPFRGEKGFLWEGGIRVPAIVVWRGNLPGGTAVAQLAMSMDWLPTLLSAAGAKPDPAYPTDGVDLMPVLGGAPEFERTVFWRTQDMMVARKGPWKYIRWDTHEYLANLASAIQRGRSRREAEYGVAVTLVGVATRRQGFFYRDDGFDVATLLEWAAVGRPLAAYPGARRWETAGEGLAQTQCDVMAEASGTNPRHRGQPSATSVRPLARARASSRPARVRVRQRAPGKDFSPIWWPLRVAQG